jgi:hypothetical protein
MASICSASGRRNEVPSEPSTNSVSVTLNTPDSVQMVAVLPPVSL